MGNLIWSFLFAILASFVVGHGIVGFSSPMTFVRQRTLMSNTPLLFGALDQQPHESDAAYMKRLMEVASDASSFEKAVMAGDSSYQVITSSSSSTKSNGYQRANNNNDSNTTNKKKGTYQRAEEWDAQRQANGTMTWEEKVQWDGQRHGNRVNQNDILRHHLNTF